MFLYEKLLNYYTYQEAVVVPNSHSFVAPCRKHINQGRRPKLGTRLDDNQIKEAFIKGGRGHPPSHLKFFLLVFSKLKEDIK